MGAGTVLFPTTIDDNGVKTGADEITSGGYNSHSEQIEALEAKVGVDSSAVVTSFDYFWKHASGRFRTHVHDGGADDGANVPEANVVFSGTGHAHGGTTDGENIPEANVIFGASGHDHSGTTNGNPLPAAGLETDAVETAKIKDDAVTVDKINITAKARAYLSADQTDIVNATWTKVNYDAESYDVGSNFASSKFTAPVTGYYLIVGKIDWQDMPADISIGIALYVNGSNKVQNIILSSALDNANTVDCTDIRLLTANDYVEMYAYHLKGDNTPDIEGGGDGTDTSYMAVHLLST